MPGEVDINLSPKPLPLPPPASLLNQITPLAHAHRSPFFTQLPSILSASPTASSSSFPNLDPFALFIYWPPTDNVKNASRHNPIGKNNWRIYVPLVDLCARVTSPVSACLSILTGALQQWLRLPFHLIKFPSSSPFPSCVPACAHSKCQTKFGHMERHLVPHHPSHTDTKTLTARRVNLESRQGSSYLLAKVPQCQSSARSAARPPTSLHRSHTYTHTHTLAPSTPMTLGDDRETEGLCLAEPLPAPPQHILYNSLPNLRTILHRRILTSCSSEINANRVCDAFTVSPKTHTIACIPQH